MDAMPVDVIPVDAGSCVESTLETPFNSSRLASSVLICAAYVDGTAEENHGGLDVSSRAA